MNRILPLLCILWASTAFGQSGNQGQFAGPQTAHPERNIPDMLLTRVEQKLNWGKGNLQEGNYQGSAKNSRRALDDLEILKTLLMPLDERLKSLRDREKNILSRTTSFQNNNNLKKAEADLLYQDQIANRDETKLAIQQAAAQKQNLGKGSSAKKTNPDQIEKFQKTLEAVEKLLTEAKQNEDLAAGEIKSKKFMAAVPYEKSAVEKLEKALKTLQESGGKQSKNKKSANKEKQKQQGKKDQKKGDQKQSKQTAAEKQDGKNGAKKGEKEKKFSRKDALRELARLRKEAGKRRKDRELKYGEAVIQKREVERNW